MTAQPNKPLQLVPTLDDDVNTYLHLTERMEDLKAQLDVVKSGLRSHGEGKHETSFGVTVTVTPPPRSFNADRAWSMLSAEQQAQCVTADPKKIKSQLPPVLTEQCMDAGTGEPRLSVK